MTKSNYSWEVQAQEITIGAGIGTWLLGDQQPVLIEPAYRFFYIP